MLNSLASNARKYWAMHIADDVSRAGFRVGGLPPGGVTPTFVNELTQYFGTFPITDSRDQEMSIFCSFDYLDPESANFITRNIEKPLDAGSEVIECVFHNPSMRSENSDLASELHAYSVSVGAQSIDDPENETCGVPHKIGGIAFLRNSSARARKASSDLAEAGYIHVLQFGYPGPRDCKVKGAWPFHNYRFHLYLRESGEHYEYKALLV